MFFEVVRFLEVQGSSYKKAQGKKVKHNESHDHNNYNNNNTVICGQQSGIRSLYSKL